MKDCPLENCIPRDLLVFVKPGRCIFLFECHHLRLEQIAWKQNACKIQSILTNKPLFPYLKV